MHGESLRRAFYKGLYFLPQILTLLLHVTTNLSDQHDTLRLVVIEEELDEVEGGGAGVRVTADADADGLAETNVGRLGDGLVGEGTRARDDTCRGSGDGGVGEGGEVNTLSLQPAYTVCQKSKLAQ